MENKKNTFYKVNVLDVFEILKADKKNLIIFAVVFSVIGLVIAFTTPKVYKSSVVLAPEETEQGFSGSVSSLASMIGMNMKFGQSGDAIYPEIYPDLVASSDFLLKLFPIQVTKKDNSLTCDYYTYLTKHQKVALVDWPMVGLMMLKNALTTKEKDAKAGKDKLGKQTDILYMTQEESEIIDGMRGRIECMVDKKTNVITLTVTDQDPVIAATVVDSVKSQLQIAITDYRTKKARNDLQYMEKLFAEARHQYDRARQLYASFADANMDVNLQSYKMKGDDLENDMQLKYNVYQQIVEQLQLARAKVQERTPAFTVMQSAVVPQKHSSRSKLMTLVMWLCMGLMVRVLILAWKNRKKILNAQNNIQ